MRTEEWTDRGQRKEKTEGGKHSGTDGHRKARHRKGLTEKGKNVGRDGRRKG